MILSVVVFEIEGAEGGGFLGRRGSLEDQRRIKPSRIVSPAMLAQGTQSNLMLFDQGS